MSENYLSGMGIGVLLGLAMGMAINDMPVNTNPNYVNPKSLEFKVEGSDSNKVTFAYYDGKSYLLGFDKKRKPEFFEIAASTGGYADLGERKIGFKIAK